LILIPKGEIIQFDKDVNGKYAETFLKLREILLSFQEIKETKNANI